MWSGKNTPKDGPGGPSGSSPLRHGSPLRQAPDVRDVESLIDAKFANLSKQWHEQQLAMYRGVMGPAFPS